MKPITSTYYTIQKIDGVIIYANPVYLEVLFIRKIQSTNLKINKERAKNNSQKLTSNMPLINCSCGTKILVVPDVAAMDKAIKNHLSEHKEADEQFLIAQILKVASKQRLF